MGVPGGTDFDALPPAPSGENWRQLAPLETYRRASARIAKDTGLRLTLEDNRLDPDFDVDESVDSGFNQPTTLPKREPLWPIEPHQEPEIVHSVQEFLEIVFFQPHLDRFVVFPGGMKHLRQSKAIPRLLRDAVAKSRNIRDVFQALPEEDQAKVKARLWHFGHKGVEREIRVKDNKDKDKDDSGDPGKKNKPSMLEIGQALRRQDEEGIINPEYPLYVTELRWLQKKEHPLVRGEMVKTMTQCDIYDCMEQLSRRMPLWERSEGGIFVGERGGGSSMHVDQCLWSNVGRNFCGHKLMAVWPHSERIKILDDAGKNTIFHLPLSDEHAGFLKRACKIGLLGPGDAYCFSGGQPHMALVVGDGVCVTGYESMVTCHPYCMSLLVRSNITDDHWRKNWMDDEDLDELYEDVVDSIQKARHDSATSPLLRQSLEECVQVMREEGDKYTKELWEDEDKGLRHRRREDEFESADGEDANCNSEQPDMPPRKKARSSEGGSNFSPAMSDETTTTASDRA